MLFDLKVRHLSRYGAPSEIQNSKNQKRKNGLTMPFFLYPNGNFSIKGKRATRTRTWNMQEVRDGLALR